VRISRSAESPLGRDAAESRCLRALNGRGGNQGPRLRRRRKRTSVSSREQLEMGEKVDQL